MAEESNRGWRRKQYLINKRMQLTVIGFNVGLAFIAIVIYYIQNRLVFSKFFGLDRQEVLADPIMREMIEKDMFFLNMTFLVTSVGVLVAMCVGGLILSNRVAGPIYRIQKHIESVIDGKTTNDVKFRKNDYFQELAETFNKFLAIYRDKVK